VQQQAKKDVHTSFAITFEFYIFNTIFTADKQLKKITFTPVGGSTLSYVGTVVDEGMTNNNYTYYYTLDLTQLNEATLDKDHPDGKVDLTITLE
jgi:hypothetical protein